MVNPFYLSHQGWNSGAVALLCSVLTVAASIGVQAQDRLPWQSGSQPYGQSNGDAYAGPPTQPYQQAQQGGAPDPYSPNGAYQPSAPPSRYDNGPRNDAYVPPGQASDSRDSGRAPAYNDPPPRYVQPYRPPQEPDYSRQYGSNDRNEPPYGQDSRRYDDRYDQPDDSPPRMPDSHRGTYSENEVVDAGHRFFGSLSKGLAKAVQWAFQKQGRPNGYILGEDAGGAFVAGLRYGEGKLFTKNYGERRVFWQGPSIGYDFGGDGNRTMTLVYNLRSPGGIYRRFGGVQGAAYLVGGVSVQLLTADDTTLAPIRTGVGLRLGANIGYLKYTRRPTWNPF